ncbi:MAG: glycosyltransferase family 2 protein [Bacteroidales bacterium]|jgi:abequosyltransferase|nr:glycosyltransferase family 2 protein [Bacteroidales bacterium]
MKLSILLPTYNREYFLLKNLKMLAGYISKGSLQEEVEIVVSNNQSTDNTDEEVKLFKRNNKDIQIQYFLQKENMGLEKNALFVLKEAKGEYVMYLGDDDFIKYEYLLGCLKYVHEDESINCIIPSNTKIDVNGNKLQGGRDIDLPITIRNPGFKNCLINSQRGHQLSGLLFKKSNVYNMYKEFGVNNIYPFVFFVAYSSLFGKTILFTKYPVKITAAPQTNKDWSYGKDELINDIFDNYKKLPLSYLKRTRLQIYFFYKQNWRLCKHLLISPKSFIITFVNMWFSRNSTFLFKLIFPLLVTFVVFKRLFKRFLRLIKLV